MKEKEYVVHLNYLDENNSYDWKKVKISELLDNEEELFENCTSFKLQEKVDVVGGGYVYHGISPNIINGVEMQDHKNFNLFVKCSDGRVFPSPNWIDEVALNNQAISQLIELYLAEDFKEKNDNDKYVLNRGIEFKLKLKKY